MGSYFPNVNGKVLHRLQGGSRALDKAATEILENKTFKPSSPAKPGKELNKLSAALAVLFTQVDLTLRWIPAPCGIGGYEIADRLAKDGGRPSGTF